MSRRFQSLDGQSAAPVCAVYEPETYLFGGPRSMRLVHELTKARALAALRHDAGLPRSAFVRGASRAKPVPVDFAALPTLHLLERICAHQPGPELLVEETLHAPRPTATRAPRNSPRSPPPH
ncbi:hypothetical protein BIV25_10440 [Streptomyces sp. MUSC 14]|uniref:hypothetical protein n=1 Tax=Streptomyces sp. MUSC 14 TaxID=1354889 RepID=UPI0008F5B5E7|nr:hypothetical protein [Streptomyces sp. MUSC 14]OIJ99414.1 hypothetical protein BIV25_10440 [Streptomyces sp. MUSC 14]